MTDPDMKPRKPRRRPVILVLAAIAFVLAATGVPWLLKDPPPNRQAGPCKVDGDCPQVCDNGERVRCSPGGTCFCSARPGKCHSGRECDMKCEFGHAVCQWVDGPHNARSGVCRCRTREEIEQVRRSLPPTCRDPVMGLDDGEAMDWKCSDPPDGGDGGT